MIETASSFEIWIAQVRDTLPQLRAKLEKFPRSVEGTNTSFGSVGLSAEVHLFESILKHHDQLAQNDLEADEMARILEAVHHDIQGCAQNAIDKAKYPDSDETLLACLGALADIDDRMIRLGRPKVQRSSSERKTSD